MVMAMKDILDKSKEATWTGMKAGGETFTEPSTLCARAKDADPSVNPVYYANLWCDKLDAQSKEIYNNMVRDELSQPVARDALDSWGLSRPLTVIVLRGNGMVYRRCSWSSWVMRFPRERNRERASGCYWGLMSLEKRPV